MQEKKEEINLLELRPRRLNFQESVQDGNVVVLVPKFPGKLAQILMPKISKTNFKLKLDAFGSFVWRNCNGEISVKEIADKLKIEFGTSVEPVYERTSKFIRQLQNDKLIDLGLEKEKK